MNTHRFICQHLLHRSCLSWMLYPLGKIYGNIQKLRRKVLVSRAWRAPCMVISIGNLTAGGSGKTPLAIALARMLRDNGIKVGISHRGYKGKFEAIPTLVASTDKILFSAADIGDEAYLIASNLKGIPVVVGKQRRDAIKLMLKLYPATQVIILDDSFQHLQVHHDLNILSFCTDTGLGNGFVLPAGYLREDLSAISAKDWAVIYSRNGRSAAKPWEEAIASRVQKLFYSFSTVDKLQNAAGDYFPIESLKQRSIALVSGIAAPQSFEETVIGLSLKFNQHYAYPDHYDFQDRNCLDKLRRDPSEILLCTQKDLMKLASHSELAPRLAALVQDYHIEVAENFRTSILAVVSQK